MKPGIQLHVTSWENDGDNYKTQILDGLTADDTAFLIYIAQQFGRAHSHNEFGVSGNEENSLGDLAKMYRAALEKFPSITDQFKIEVPDEDLVELYEEFDNIPYSMRKQEKDAKYDAVRGFENVAAQFSDYIFELLDELLGQAGEYYDAGFVRVCESIKVLYIPGEIKDITEQFIPTTKGKK